MTKRAVAILILQIVGISFVAFSQEYGRIQGRVVSGEYPGYPRRWVIVQVIGSTRAVQTDKEGYYSIDRLPPGTYTLQIAESVLDPETSRSVVVEPSQVDTVDFRLFSCGTRKAYEDLKKGTCQLLVNMLEPRILPVALEDELTDRYGYRLRHDGGECTDGYNRVVLRYLDSVNVEGWEKQLAADRSRLEAEYLRQLRGDW